MRFRGLHSCTFSSDFRCWPAIGLVVIAVLFFTAGSVYAQSKEGGGGGSPSNNPPNTGNTTPRPRPNTDSVNRGPIFVSGKVVLNDGSPLPQPAKLERVCAGSVRVEGYTDPKGNFSIQLGAEIVLQDASMASADGLPPGTFPGSMRGNSIGSSDRMNNGVDERQLASCELRAELTGFRSDNVPLAHIRYLDNPDIGIIVLRRLGNVAGLTVSATAALAPKEAKKLFEKGMEAEVKKKPDEAKANFEKVVALYPKHAAAWFELGKLSEQRKELEEARKDYDQSLVADSKFIPPLDRLSWMAVQDANWQRLDELSARWVSLDPLNNPISHYLHAVANLQLKSFDVAEKSAREAIRLDPAKKNMRSHYVLGLVLASKQKYAASSESIRTFLNSSPNIADADAIRQQLAQIEEASKAAPQPSPSSSVVETKSDEEKSKQ